MVDNRLKTVRNVPELLNLAEVSFPNAIAMAVNEDGTEKTETYMDFIQAVRKVGDCLENRFGAGKIYAIPGDMSREWLLVFFGILYSGSIAAPLDLFDGAVQKLEKLKPGVILTGKSFPQSIKELIDGQFSGIPSASMEEVCASAFAGATEGKIRPSLEPEHTALLVFTSGTTGENKIVEITHRNLCADTCLALTYLGPDYPIGTRFLTALPLYHMYALTSCIMCPVMGGYVICAGNGPLKLKSDIQFFRPHLLMVVPMMLSSFFRKLFPDPVLVTSEQLEAAKKYFGGRLRLLYSGGAPLGRDYYDIMNLLGIFLVNGYGITECSPIVSYDNEAFHKEGSVGKANILPKVCSIKIKAGEICIKGEIVSPGYWKEPELNRMVYDEEGWFHTGDLGKLDEDGFLYITGRKKNILVLPDGNNISLDELEKQLSGCPSIESAIVLGREMLNNPVLEAVVVPRKDTGLSQEELEKQIDVEIETVNKKNPRYKRIAQIRFLDTDFERTPLGKVRKFKYET